MEFFLIALFVWIAIGSIVCHYCIFGDEGIIDLALWPVVLWYYWRRG